MRNHRKNGAKYLNIERLNNTFSKKNCIEIIYPLILLFHHGTIKNSFLVFTFVNVIKIVLEKYFRRSLYVYRSIPIPELFECTVCMCIPRARGGHRSGTMTDRDGRGEGGKG